MTLVDTSVWIDHLRRGNPQLGDLIENGLVLVHPFVIGELACGALKQRHRILTDLETLPCASIALHDDVMNLVESRALWNRGIRWIDCHLLASAILSNCALWTLDASLQRAALALKIP